MIPKPYDDIDILLNPLTLMFVTLFVSSFKLLSKVIHGDANNLVSRLFPYFSRKIGIMYREIISLLLIQS